MFDAEGNKTGFVGISYDISERIQKDQELQLAKEKAEKLAKSKQEFLANMSHEIRTPLNGIIGISNLLEDKDFEDAHTNKLIQMLSYSAKNLNVLINDILDLAKIESGKVTLENEGHLLEEHLQMLAQNFESLCNRNGIDFVFKSEIPKDLFIHSDIYRLTQVVNNLVNNAIKFTLKGNVGLAVGFQKNSDTFVTLTFNITDTGIGLTQEEIQKLSEPFMQANDKIARQFGGTGLGLSIVKSVLQMFNSELIIESKKGTGSSFSFKVEMEIEAQKTAQVASKDSNQQLLTGIKILCVEDNVINQMVIKKMLTNLKAIVDIAADGQSAIDMANATYDIILMDLRLPDFDGFDVTERIVEKLGDKAPAIVACTADVVESRREKVSKSFMQGFIVKPVVEAQLIAIIKELTKKVK